MSRRPRAKADGSLIGAKGVSPRSDGRQGGDRGTIYEMCIGVFGVACDTTGMYTGHFLEFAHGRRCSI